MPSPSLEFKRGDTFDFSGQVSLTDSGVVVQDMTGWTGASQLRTSLDVKITDLTFAWLDAAQRLCRITGVATSEWPLGDLFMDVEFTSPAGDVVSTQTANIKMVKDITR